MQYSLNEDQKLFHETIKRMARERLALKAQEVDRSSEFPWEFFELFREYGLPGLNIPEEYGGIGGDRLTCALVLEEIGKTCNTSSIILGISLLANLVVTLAGNEDQKKRFLPKVARGEAIFAMSLVEPGMPFNIEEINTVATLKDDYYVLDGKAPFISNADIADYLLLLAKNGAQGGEGIDIFVVEKNLSEYGCEKKGELLGEGSRQACEVVFEGCKVAKENRFISKEGGYKKVIEILEENNFITAARAVGLAQGAFDHAIEYAKTRVQFGRPIIKFQGIQFIIADMGVKIQAARQLLYKACTEMEKGSKDAVKLGAMVKSLASDVAMEVSVNSVQLLGGYGVSTEYPLTRYYRNAKLTSIVEGSPDIHKGIIARELLV